MYSYIHVIVIIANSNGIVNYTLAYHTKNNISNLNYLPNSEFLYKKTHSWKWCFSICFLFPKKKKNGKLFPSKHIKIFGQTLWNMKKLFPFRFVLVSSKHLKKKLIENWILFQSISNSYVCHHSKNIPCTKELTSIWYPRTNFENINECSDETFSWIITQNEFVCIGLINNVIWTK